MNPCNEIRRFENIEEDISELKETIKLHSSEIATLRENQSETRIYVKQIFERLEDIKTLFQSSNSNTTAAWVKVTMELIKAIGVIAGIIAGIKILS